MFVLYDPANPASNNSFIDIAFELGLFGSAFFILLISLPLLRSQTADTLALWVLFIWVNIYKGSFAHIEWFIMYAFLLHSKNAEEETLVKEI
jgi:hypothetical protein